MKTRIRGQNDGCSNVISRSIDHSEDHLEYPSTYPVKHIVFDSVDDNRSVEIGNLAHEIHVPGPQGLFDEVMVASRFDSEGQYIAIGL